MRGGSEGWREGGSNGERREERGRSGSGAARGNAFSHYQSAERQVDKNLLFDLASETGVHKSTRFAISGKIRWGESGSKPCDYVTQRKSGIRHKCASN
eukprot:4286966-Pleurochrysis_carterae.AAC.1